MTWLIPDALIVALSPMAVLPPVLLLLYSDRPRGARTTSKPPRYAEKGLERMRHWVQEHTAAITAVTLTGVGALLVVVGSS